MNKLLRIVATPLTIFGSFVVLISGLIMFFAFKNHLLEELHGQIGILLTVGVILHVVVNWRPFVNYFKKSQSYFVIIPIVIIALNLAFSNESKPGVNPKVIFSKLENSSLSTVALVFKVEPQLVIEKLKSTGINVDSPEQMLKEIATKNHKNPKDVLDLFATFDKPRGK